MSSTCVGVFMDVFTASASVGIYVCVFVVL